MLQLGDIGDCAAFMKRSISITIYMSCQHPKESDITALPVNSSV